MRYSIGVILAQAQTALLTVSLENDCNFCSVAHRALGKKAGVNPQTIESLVSRTPIADAKDRVLIELTQVVVRERGWVAEPVLSRFLEAVFTHQQIFELMLVVTIKTLSNYTNHLTRPEPNPELLAKLSHSVPKRQRETEIPLSCFSQASLRLSFVDRLEIQFCRPASCTGFHTEITLR